MPNKKIASWRQIQALVPTILQRLNANPEGLMAAAANPLMAREDLGYNVDPTFYQEFVDRIRFGAEKADRLRSLRTEVFSYAGEEFDPDSTRALDRVLFERLKLRRPTCPDGTSIAAPPLFAANRRLGEDPLVAPLLEYRALDSKAPRLASRDRFDAIKTGKYRTRSEC
jgi:DNA polymerase I-like protein with 3'-5' exonuclease and polymerase domains